MQCGGNNVCVIIQTPPPQTLSTFMFASTADSSKRWRYVVLTRSGNTSAGIQFDPFMNIGTPLTWNRNDRPESQHR